jgi:peptidoglycan hydrolase-like protein with peptidoglycan-binding domain
MTSMYLSPWPILSEGMQGWPVRPLQYLLRSHGHALTVDNSFGPETGAAVQAFGHSRNLQAEGVVTKQLWLELVVTVQRGSTGDAVRAVQDAFDYRTYVPGGFTVDGVFGPRTEAAVRGFQNALDIPSDGVVGLSTWQALLSGMLSV